MTLCLVIVANKIIYIIQCLNEIGECVIPLTTFQKIIFIILPIKIKFIFLVLSYLV